eukprot:2366268-Lingulodinium_polyedra.AAC.1
MRAPLILWLKGAMPGGACNSPEVDNAWRQVFHTTELVVEGFGEFFRAAVAGCERNSECMFSCQGHFCRA